MTTFPPSDTHAESEASSLGARPDDEACMQVALQQAHGAAQKGEVPVGAAIYQNGVLIAKAHNSPIAHCDPTAHAEVLVLQEAAKVLGNYRLQDCTLYVSLEPCAMCAGAIFNARVREVVFAAKDAKSGVAGSVLNLFEDARINHHTRVRGGVLAQESVQLLQSFFQSQRQWIRQEASAAKRFLREDALRKPITEISGFEAPHAQSAYHVLQGPDPLKGMRLHYRQMPALGELVGKKTYLCLHGANTSSNFFEPLLIALGRSLTSDLPFSTPLAAPRVLVPDFLGHGASDRFKKPQAHRFAGGMQALLEWMEEVDVQELEVITHDASLVWGLVLKALMPQRVSSLVMVNPSWKPDLARGESAAGERSAPLKKVSAKVHSSSLGLYEQLGAWLQRGAKTPDLKRHFARLSPHLSTPELEDLASGFDQVFERAVFEAYDRLFPSVQEGLADWGLALSDLQKHLSPAFLRQCTWVRTHPLDGSDGHADFLAHAFAPPSLHPDPLALALSGLASSSVLLEAQFLSKASMTQLAGVLHSRSTGVLSA